uniref:Thromboxane-A synthase n=1 Tax=Astyanax mexicanus TaxID=7994 RepID=A0A3B1JLK7_ASTMX
MIGAEASGFTVTLGLFLLFLALLYYSVYPFSVLQRCGIRHPKPIPFFGNMMLFRHGFFDAHRDLINQYGRVCYYLGRRPVVVVADPDMLRQVMVKEFQKFPNRMQKLRAATKPMTESVLMLRNERWKRVRSILTPSFSAAKMKEMVPLINTATETLLNNLKSYAESGESFDIHAFPFLIRPLSFIIPNKSRDEMNGFFISCIQKIIKQRDELPPNQRRRDFLQLMLDVRSSKECVSLENFDVVNHADEQAEEQPQVAEEAANGPGSSGDAPKRPQQKRMMTEDEIVGQAFLFLLAGYETSSNTLAFACYLLAINPDCQEKLQREVDDFFTRHGSADYTNVQELKYLDMVVCEALRLYPPGFFARDVEEDCVINGQFLPKGATLDISAGFLHHDPQYWPEPEKFIPEFTPEAKASRHPFVYLPFGAGPRSCVGMRLAQLEIRMALVNIFKKFNVVACEDTKLKSSTTLGPKNGIFVKITKRL